MNKIIFKKFYVLKLFLVFLSCIRLYAAAEPGSAQPSQLYDKNADFRSRLYYMADVANHYYKEKYYDEARMKKGDDVRLQGTLIRRANHGLAHGLRQGALARDLVFYLAEFGNQRNGMVKWIRSRLEKDHWFIDKVMFLAIMSRTGRGSEKSFSEEPEANIQYTQLSMDIFRKEAEKMDLYSELKDKHDESELDKYAFALEWMTSKSLGQSRVTKNMRTIFKSAHILDLRRLSNVEKYNMDKLKNELFDVWQTRGSLFSNPEPKEEAWNFLWEKAGEYLDATGDRNPQVGVRWYTPLFKDLALNPQAMVDALFPRE